MLNNPFVDTARPESLVHADHRRPGIARLRRGAGFRYEDARGAKVSDAATLRRIRSLVIPPAWRDVWISPDAQGHIQATGFDVRGRRQYMYHDDWTAHRSETKFDGLLEFARVLPAIRAQSARDMRLPGMPRDKVLACVVYLLDATLIRIGNSEYARQNDSYGLTTMRNHHARIRGTQIAFRFRAKSGKECEAQLRDPLVARIVRRCQDLPGQELFAYLNGDRTVHDVTSTDVNAYLKQVSGLEVTAKHFRTWGGTVAAAESLLASGEPRDAETGEPLSQRQLKAREVAAIKASASALCNTVAVSRKSYVHPKLVAAYAAGELDAAREKARKSRGPRTFSVVERTVLWWLRGLARE